MNGSWSFHSGCFGASAFDAVDGERQLEVQGLLGPQRAVVVEGGDPFGRRHELRRPGLVTAATKSTIDCFVLPAFHDGSGSRGLRGGGRPTTSVQQERGA